MRSRLDSPQEPPPPSAPRQPSPDHARFIKISDAFSIAEVPWTVLAGLVTYVSYLMNANPALPWIGLALACLPFPLRLLQKRRVIARTPFDIPMALLILGAIVGVCVSPERTMSLGAFQCMLAALISYYVFASCDRQVILMKFLILALPVGLIIVLILILANVPEVFNPPHSESGSSNTNHGLALELSLAGALLFGVAVFGRSRRIRIPTAVASIGFFVTVFFITSRSLRSLVTGVSVEGRLPLWRATIDLLRESPVTGLGLGCWARLKYGTMALLDNPDVNEITHSHNAYLELYSNTGLLGILALVVFLVVGARLSLDIIRSPRSHPWYGFGCGVVLACVITLLVGIVESAPIGAPHMAAETYYYIIAPIPSALCAFLVAAHRLITRDETG